MKNNNNNNFPIQCGKCKCKYFPKFKYHSVGKVKNDDYIVDNSCPQCGFGLQKAKSIAEEYKGNKKLLLD